MSDDTNRIGAVSPSPSANTLATTSLMRRADDFSPLLRYGLPLYLIGTLVFIIISQVGSGVTAIIEFVNLRTGETDFREEILTVTVLSSVGELWRAGSYALALLIALTSISWPYIKLSLTFYAWVMPVWNPQRRERLLVWLDALGKWSFVDVYVLMIFMVAFRTDSPIQGFYTAQVYVVGRWGLYCYVGASILSLASAHLVLHLYRSVLYPMQKRDNHVSEEEAVATMQRTDNRTPRGSNKNKLLPLALLGVTAVLILVGSLIDIYRLDYFRAGTNVRQLELDVVRIGTSVPDAALDPSNAGIRFLQVIYFILSLGAPMLNLCLMGALCFRQQRAPRWLSTFAKTTFAWSGVEVFFISAVISISQVPKLATALVEDGCQTCFQVESTLQASFAVISLAAALTVGLSVSVMRSTNSLVYGSGVKEAGLAEDEVVEVEEEEV